MVRCITNETPMSLVFGHGSTRDGHMRVGRRRKVISDGVPVGFVRTALCNSMEDRFRDNGEIKQATPTGDSRAAAAYCCSLEGNR